MKRWSPAMRRYLARFAPTIISYVIILIVVEWIFRHHPPVGPIRYVLAMLPAVPVIGIIVILGLYLVDEIDEFERTVLVQAILWATGAALAFNTIHDALMNFLNFPPMPMFSLFTVWAMVWGLAQPLIRWRYR